MSNVHYLGLPNDPVQTLKDAAARCVTLALEHVATAKIVGPLKIVYTDNSPSTSELYEPINEAMRTFARAFEALFIQDDGELKARAISSISNTPDRGLMSLGTRCRWDGGIRNLVTSIAVDGSVFTYRAFGKEVRVEIDTQRLKLAE